MVFVYNTIPYIIFLKRGDLTMKTTVGVILAAGLGYCAWAIYKKYNPVGAERIKGSFCKMNKEATKNIENMM